MPIIFYPYLYDLVVVAAVIIFFCIGRKNGAAKMCLLFIGSALAIIAATVLSTLTSRFLFDTFLRTNLTDSIAQALPSSANLKELFENISSDVPAISAALAILLNYRTRIPSLESLLSSAAENTAVTLVDSFISPIVVSLLQSITFIFFFIILFLFIRLLARSLGLLNKVPLLGWFNRFFGIIFGLALCFLLLILLTAALYLAFSLDLSTDFFSEQTIQNSLIYHHLYKFIVFHLF